MEVSSRRCSVVSPALDSRSSFRVCSLLRKNSSCLSFMYSDPASPAVRLRSGRGRPWPSRRWPAWVGLLRRLGGVDARLFICRFLAGRRAKPVGNLSVARRQRAVPRAQRASCRTGWPSSPAAGRRSPAWWGAGLGRRRFVPVRPSRQASALTALVTGAFAAGRGAALTSGLSPALCRGRLLGGVRPSRSVWLGCGPWRRAFLRLALLAGVLLTGVSSLRRL